MKPVSPKTEYIYSGDPEENMYGCLPCPECGSRYRASFACKLGISLVECDDCGYRAKSVLHPDPH